MILGLESQVALDAKAVTHLATLLKGHRWKFLCVPAENGEPQRRVKDMEGKPLEVVSSAKQLQVKVSAMTEKRNTLKANCEKFALEVQCMSSLAEEARILHTCLGVEESVNDEGVKSTGKAQNCEHGSGH